MIWLLCLSFVALAWSTATTAAACPAARADPIATGRFATRWCVAVPLTTNSAQAIGAWSAES